MSGRNVARDPAVVAWLTNYSLVRMIVRLIADGKVGGPAEAVRTIATFSQASRLTSEAAMGMVGYVMGLAPVRAIATDIVLRWMPRQNFIAELVRTARESQSSALMPRIASLAADPLGARVADALYGKLVASLRRATVNGEPMYGDDDTPIETLASETILRLRRGAGRRHVGHNLRAFITAFLRLSRAARTAHALVYGPMCNWDVRLNNFAFACSALGQKYEVVTFNSDLYWDTSAVTNMTSMFSGNGEFHGDLSTWDVSNVTLMDDMFSASGIEDSGIGSWDVGALTSAYGMLLNATQLSPKLVLSRWNVDECRVLSSMFASSSVTDSGIGKWVLHSDATTSSMLENATLFRGDLSWSDKHRRDACAPRRVSPNGASMPIDNPRQQFGSQAKKRQMRRRSASTLSLPCSTIDFAPSEKKADARSCEQPPWLEGSTRAALPRFDTTTPDIHFQRLHFF
jgi:surface protein